MLHPFALFALISLPLVYWLHRFHRKPKVRIVSSLYLWSTEKDRPIGGRTKQRFIQSLSFWLELLACLLLTLLLIDPNACSGRGVHHILIVDTSASMSATSIQTDLQQRISATKSLDRLTIIEAGYNATIRGQFQHNYEAINTLESLSFNYPHSALQQAISLARSITNDKIEVWTDVVPTIEQRGIEWHALEQSNTNIGIVASKWTDSTLEITILNSTKTTKNVQITATTQFQDPTIEDPNPLTQQVSISSNTTEPIRFQVQKTARAITIHLNKDSSDNLSIDDDITTFRSQPTPLRIATDLPFAFGTAIGVFDSTGRPPVYRLIDAAKTSTPMYADVLFSNRDIGGDLETWRLHFVPLQETAWTQDFYLDEAHPFLQGVYLQNVLWEYDPSKRLRGRILIESNTVPLLTEETNIQSGKKIFHFNIGQRSTLFQSPDWPILLQNILSTREQYLSGFSKDNLTVGEMLFGKGLESGTWTIKGPAGTSTQEVRSGVLSYAADVPGVYSILAPDKTIAHKFAVNLLSAAESTLSNTNVQTLPTLTNPEQIESHSTRWRLWVWLILIGVLVWNWRINQ